MPLTKVTKGAEVVQHSSMRSAGEVGRPTLHGPHLNCLIQRWVAHVVEDVHLACKRISQVAVSPQHCVVPPGHTNDSLQRWLHTAELHEV